MANTRNGCHDSGEDLEHTLFTQPSITRSNVTGSVLLYLSAKERHEASFGSANTMLFGGYLRSPWMASGNGCVSAIAVVVGGSLPVVLIDAFSKTIAKKAT